MMILKSVSTKAEWKRFWKEFAFMAVIAFLTVAVVLGMYPLLSRWTGGKHEAALGRILTVVLFGAAAVYVWAEARWKRKHQTPDGQAG